MHGVNVRLFKTRFAQTVEKPATYTMHSRSGSQHFDLFHSNYLIDCWERMTMVEKIKEIIAVQLNISEEEVTEDASFKNDLGADSLDLFELVMALESEFPIEIPMEDYQEMYTVGDVIKYLRKKGFE